MARRKINLMDTLNSYGDRMDRVTEWVSSYTQWLLAQCVDLIEAYLTLISIGHGDQAQLPLDCIVCHELQRRHCSNFVFLVRFVP